MILGFAYRSPDVIRLMLDQSKYAATIIPKASETGLHSKTYEASLTQPVGTRKRVFLFADCRSLSSISRMKGFDKSNHIYVVFDSASILASKVCVDVVDASNPENLPIWQYKKTMPTTLAKVFASASIGISKEDLDCLNSVTENPEDRIKTDIPKRLVESKSKRSRFIDELKGIVEHKSVASNTDLKALVSMFAFGLFVNPLETKSKIRNLRSIGLQKIRTYKADSSATASAKFVKRAKKIGIDVSQVLSSIEALTKHHEYKTLVLGMIQLRCGMTVDKSASSTGCDANALFWLNNGYLAAMANKTVVGPYKTAVEAYPLKVIKHNLAVTLEAERVDEKTVRLRKGVPAGMYTEEALLRECGLLRGGENLSTMKASKTGAVFKTNIPKFKTKTKQLKYQVEKNKRYYVKFKSTRAKVSGI